MKTYKEIAGLIQAITACKKAGQPINIEWADRHEDRLRAIMKTAPSGSGIDCGTKLSEISTSERLVFDVSFHHMNEAGMYDGWTEHQIIVTPSLALDFYVRVTGRDRNGIKEYLAEIYNAWLDEDTPIEPL